MKINTRTIVLNGIIAAVYAALTVGISPLSYGQIQFRIAEIMVFLAFYKKDYIAGLTLGCLIANFFSPMGIYDVIFGTIATLIATTLISFSPNKIVAALAGAIVNGVIVGIELHYVLNLPLMINMLYVGLGELAVLLIGALIFSLVEHNEAAYTFIKNT